MEFGDLGILEQGGVSGFGVRVAFGFGIWECYGLGL